MEISKNTDFLILKINTPIDIDFFYEHYNQLKKHDYVWFCKFGKSNIRFDKMILESPYIILIDSKINNYKTYLIKISEYSSEAPLEYYPQYYKNINLQKNNWFKITKIQELSSSYILENFVTKSSNGQISSVLKSMCQSFYVTSIKNINI